MTKLQDRCTAPVKLPAWHCGSHQAAVRGESLVALRHHSDVNKDHTFKAKNKDQPFKAKATDETFMVKDKD